MHNVSNAWVINQNKQLRKKTDIRAKILMSDKPTNFSRSGVSKIFCLDAMSFGNLGTGNHVGFDFDTPITLDFSKIKYDITPITSVAGKNSTYITLYNDNGGTILSRTNLASIESMTPAPIYSNVAEIIFEQVGSEVDAKRTECKYFSTNGFIELDSGDLESLEYRSHCDVMNSDLPYRKITLRTIQKSIPLNTVCAFFEIGYDGINSGNDEYLPLGCGYYYLDKASYDEFKQQYIFIDIISTLTQKYIWGDLSQDTNYRQIVNRALNSRNNFSSITNVAISRGYPITYLPNYSTDNIPNITTPNYPVDKTIAQTLQLIAQASGLTLYLDESNTIRFVNVSQKSPIADTNVNWVLNKPQISHKEKWGTLFINTFWFKGSGDTEIAKIPSGEPAGIYFVDIKGAYRNVRPIGTSVLADDIMTYNFIEQNKASDSMELDYYGYQFNLQVRSSYQYRSSLGDAKYTLDLEIARTNANITTVKDYYTYWLNHWHNTELETRLDPKYEVLDIIENDNFGSFVVEDIEATYNGGYKGTLGGTIVIPHIKAPVLKSRNIVSINNYSFKIYNPNTDFIVNLKVHYSGGTLTYTIMPLETLELNQDNADNLEYAVGYWLDDDLTDEVSCYFEYNDGITTAQSDNTILLNEIQAPTMTNLTVHSNTEYSFTITNNNDMEMELYLHHSSGDLYDYYILQPGESIEINQDNGEFGTDAYYWLIQGLQDDVYCWFRNQHGTTTSNTMILEANYNETSILSNKQITDYDTYSFDITNPHNFAVVLKFWYLDTYLANILTIPANSTVHLDQDNLSSDWVQLIADDIDGVLDENIYAQLFDSDNNAIDCAVVLWSSYL